MEGERGRTDGLKPSCSRGLTDHLTTRDSASPSIQVHRGNRATLVSDRVVKRDWWDGPRLKELNQEKGKWKKEEK